MSTDPKENPEELSDKEKQQEVLKRDKINQTDPQKTELKGFVDPNEPLEVEGTPNPLNPLTD